MSAAPDDAPSDSTNWRLAAAIVLALLAAVMAILVPRHEPWFDEAQAWLLARDASVWDIVWKYARYEGTPSLWHLLLAIPAKAGVPPAALNLISSGLAVCGAALLLLKSPFPRFLAVLLPAGYFFFYQYGIVARSYALLIPLLWLVAIVYPQRFVRPWLFTGLLILLSQVSLHASWIAGVFFALFALDAWLQEKWPLSRLAGPVSAFAVDTLFIVAQMRRPPDLYNPPMGGLGDRIVQVFSEMWLDSVVPLPLLSLLILIALGCFFYTRGVLLSYLLTTGGLLALFVFGFFSIWHQGMLFALLVVHAWMAWRNPVRRRIDHAPEVLWPRLTTIVLGFTAAVHVWWSAVAGWHDYQFPYSGSRDAAEYLREHGIDREPIHAFKFSTCAVLLYLDHNPFTNIAPFMPGSFWVWTKAAFATQSPAEIVKGEPPWILVGAQLRPAVEPPSPPPLPGYTVVRTFPGRFIWKAGYYRTESYYLYRRVENAIQ